MRYYQHGTIEQAYPSRSRQLKKLFHEKAGSKPTSRPNGGLDWILNPRPLD